MNINEKPSAVFLLAVWGTDFIEKFFNFGMRSLLASGNIPEMSQQYQCSFVFLTRQEDIKTFKKQTKFSQLQSYCEVEFIEISDLIFTGFYSATLTLAYERGMRSRKEQMCQTYFFFLVSDYIVANGSLANIGKLLKKGYSGITTGNFLVTEELISHLIQSSVNDRGLLELDARQMLDLAFPFLHPVSTGQSVTQNFTHATHANRLFWKVNDHVMVGRFYLRHMLCIKPEVDDFIIGSSCDYAFIPEMCPSGKVLHIQDSDDYCVIEMAPFDYERGFLSLNGFKIQKLAAHFSEWTTSMHRSNAFIPIIYHSKELSTPPLEAIQKSLDFVKQIEVHLRVNPEPLRGHYYWLSCVVAILSWIRKQNHQQHYLLNGTFAGLLQSATFSPPLRDETGDRPLLSLTTTSKKRDLSDNLKEKNLKLSFFHLWGSSPLSFPWHQDWLDDYHLSKDIKHHLAQHPRCAILGFEAMPDIVNKLEMLVPGYPFTYLFYESLMYRHENELKQLLQHTSHLMIWLHSLDGYALIASIRRCLNFLPKNSSISIYIRPPKRFLYKKLRVFLAICSADLLHVNTVCEKTQTTYNLSRSLLGRFFMHYQKYPPSSHRLFRKKVISCLGFSIVMFLCTLGNLISLLGLTFNKKKTSAVVHLKVNS